MKALDLAKQLGYNLKIVTSIGLFDNYDMFHNIFEQYEEPCRRLIVMTKDPNLQEVYEIKTPEFPLENLGNIWIKEFPILTPYSEIILDEIILSENEIEFIRTAIK